MKLIEAMKRVKMNKEKIADLQKKIGEVSANLSHETPVYGEGTKEKIEGWLQSCIDLGAENLRLLLQIARTNLETEVTIEIAGKPVKKSLAGWVWRRREYAALDFATYSKLTDRGLREGHMPSSTGTPMEVKIVRHYSPDKRDEKLVEFKSEPHLIDAALEITNATTDLIET